ncbi:MAG: hypothetical protein LUC45_06515 [Paraprevotella sp.]|nr:hypothetical protein [Paraprevotella sp.]
MDRKGDLSVMSFADGEVYIVAVKNGEKGKYISALGYSKRTCVRALCKYLSDDEVLCRKLEEGEIDPFDFQEICRQYTPDRSAGGDVYQVNLGTPLRETGGVGEGGKI